MKIYLSAILALQGAAANRVGKPGKLRGRVVNGVKRNGGIRGAARARRLENKFNRMGLDLEDNSEEYFKVGHPRPRVDADPNHPIFSDHKAEEYIYMKEQGLVGQSVRDMNHNSMEYVNAKGREGKANVLDRGSVPSNTDQYADHNSDEYISMKEQGMVDQSVMDMDHNSEEYIKAKANGMHPAPRDDPYDPSHPVFTDHNVDESVKAMTDHNSEEYIKAKVNGMHPAPRDDPYDPSHPVFTDYNVDESVKAMTDHNSEEYIKAKANGMHPAPRNDPYDPSHPVFTDYNVDESVKAMADHNSEEYIKAKVNGMHPAPPDDPFDPTYPVFTDHNVDKFEFHQDIERLQHDISVFENELEKIDAEYDEKVEAIFSD